MFNFNNLGIAHHTILSHVYTGNRSSCFASCLRLRVFKVQRWCLVSRKSEVSAFLIPYLKEPARSPTGLAVNAQIHTD